MQIFSLVVNIQFTSLPCENVLLSKRSFPCRAVQMSEMLLANCVYTSSLYSFNLFSIGGFQRAEHCDVTGLELIGGVREHSVQDNIVLKTEL